MKKKNSFIFVVACSIFLTACGNSTKDEKPVTEENGTSALDETNTTAEQAENVTTPTNGAAQDDMSEKMDELNYASFDLDIEYPNNKGYEAEIERNSNNAIEAKIEDSLNNIEKKGSEAFNELYPLLEKLDITQQTTKDEAVEEIIATFNLPKDFQQFELEFTLKDGTKVEFK
ncbi:YusW family protein [Bacillus sp. FJAT-22090]|uniref:YusW family protein n=1 Tax=Bacillus sp. FJAT-22090 TaxID=1581038 RepID=UPI0011A8E837|nr:YusW family protein [Bacillus sp. FJAT-22090]